MPEDSIHITVGDLKQWAYCPRVVYYHKIMPGCSVPTHKMTAGAKAQEWVESLEFRRTLARYGFPEGRRHTGLDLFDGKLGLKGKIDWLIEDGTRAAVIECKLTSGDPSANHRLQLAGYALLVERLLGWQVPICFVYRVPDERLFSIPITEANRIEVEKALDGIRHMMATEIIPEATELRARCTDCEFSNFCADVW
jgi:CRISPR-associated exonuclease Cas4